VKWKNCSGINGKWGGNWVKWGGKKRGFREKKVSERSIGILSAQHGKQNCKKARLQRMR